MTCHKTTSPSQARSFETTLFYLCGLLAVLFQCLRRIFRSLSLHFLHAFCRCFSHRALDLRNIPQFRLRSDHTKHPKIQRKYTNNAPQTFKQCRQPPALIERVLFQKRMFVMVEFLQRIARALGFQLTYVRHLFCRISDRRN